MFSTIAVEFSAKIAGKTFFVSEVKKAKLISQLFTETVPFNIDIAQKFP